MKFILRNIDIDEVLVDGEINELSKVHPAVQLENPSCDHLSVDVSSMRPLVRVVRVATFVIYDNLKHIF